jgi:hypothetical protein
MPGPAFTSPRSMSSGISNEGEPPVSERGNVPDDHSRDERARPAHAAASGLDGTAAFLKKRGGQLGQHPLSGLWLTRRASSTLAPLKSILDWDTGDPEALVEATGKRFDGGDYIEERLKVERWLATEGEKKGLHRDNYPPLYFYVCTYLDTAARPGRVIFNISAEHIPPDKMTFTLDDSFHNHAVFQGRPSDTTPAGLEPRILNAFELRELIERDGFPEHLDGSGGRYIDCQVWARDLPILQRAARIFDALKGKERDQACLIVPDP